MEWETVIGLEIHVQLATKSKIFSGAATQVGASPNSQACAIDLGLPGVLPVLNKEVVRMAVMFGLAIDADIARYSVFERKNYFYPDLPKGYQISQLALPIVAKGQLPITLSDGRQLTIGVTRAHLEEDAGKSLHESFNGMTGIDLNRAGTPLIEVVSEPEMHSAEEAVAYMKTLHNLVCHLGICDGNMQEGSFRCDANVSVRPRGSDTLGTRTETKNINSFRFVERAINYEVARQIDLLERGNTVRQETRLFDADLNITKTMRVKEEADDYRYFPDPDLLPIELTEHYIDDIKQQLPELPQAKIQRFQTQYQLTAYDANLIINNQLSDYFEAVLATAKTEPKLVANWINGELTAFLNQANLNVSDNPISSDSLATLLRRITDNTISGKIAKTVFQYLSQGEQDVDKIIDQQGLKQVTDHSEIAAIIDSVIDDSPKQLAQYRQGKDKLFGYFVGQVMKRTQGKANPQQVNELLKAKLNDN